MILADGDFRKLEVENCLFGPTQAVFMAILNKHRPVICRELLNKENEHFKSMIFQYATGVMPKRWEDADGYVKRLFANLALYEFKEPRSMTLRLNKKLEGALKNPDPKERKKTVNYIRDQITRKMQMLGEVPLFWFVVEPVPTQHIHGGFVLNHTKAKIFRASIKSLRNCPNNALETPLQANATEKNGVDSRHQWVTYTSKSKRIEGFDFAISRALNEDARKIYETVLNNRKVARGKI